MMFLPVRAAPPIIKSIAISFRRFGEAIACPQAEHLGASRTDKRKTRSREDIADAAQAKATEAHSLGSSACSSFCCESYLPISAWSCAEVCRVCCSSCLSISGALAFGLDQNPLSTLVQVCSN